MGTPMAPAGVLDKDAFRALYPAEFYDEFAARGVRPDGRSQAECRPPTAVLNTIGSADASASCRLGETFVTAGVRLELTQPLDADPNRGLLEAQVLLTGPGSVARERSDAADLAAALTHAVSRQLCRADTVDLAQLVVEAHRQCWRVALDIHVLNDDGCLLDACMFAAVAALSVLQIPSVEQNQKGEYIPRLVDGAPDETPLALGARPLSLTMGVHRHRLVCDLTALEEDLVESTLTVAVDDAGAVHGCLASGAESWGTELVSSAVKLAVLRHRQLTACLRSP